MIISQADLDAFHKICGPVMWNGSPSSDEIVQLGSGVTRDMLPSTFLYSVGHLHDAEGRCIKRRAAPLCGEEGERCSTCANEGGRHELWCPKGADSLTIGELRELLTKAIELDGVNESKRIGLLYRAPRSDGSTELRPAPLKSLGVHFLRGEFVFALERADLTS